MTLQCAQSGIRRGLLGLLIVAAVTACSQQHIGDRRSVAEGVGDGGPTPHASGKNHTFCCGPPLRLASSVWPTAMVL